MILCPESLSSRRKSVFTRRHNNEPIELEVKIATCHFGLFMPLIQQAKKGVTVLAGVTDADYQEEIKLLLHSGSKEVSLEYRRSLRVFLSVTMPCSKVIGKLQQPNLGKTIISLDLQE